MVVLEGQAHGLKLGSSTFSHPNVHSRLSSTALCNELAPPSYRSTEESHPRQYTTQVVLPPVHLHDIHDLTPNHAAHAASKDVDRV